MDKQQCVGCKWLHDAARPECRFKGMCPFQKLKPPGYRTPEDRMRREVRDADTQVHVDESKQLDQV